jgi:hypothetical protein
VEDSLILTGTANALINSGSDTINFLRIAKTTAANEVKLSGQVKIGKGLSLEQGVFTTDPLLNPGFQISAPASATFSFIGNNEIIGSVKRTSWTNGSPVIFHQPNMTVATTGGTAPIDVTVNMIPSVAGGDPSLNFREVKRKFNLGQTGGSGFTADVKFPYQAGELNTNTEASLAPWSYETGDWTAKLTSSSNDTVNNFVSSTGISASQFSQEWKIADAKYIFSLSAALRGPWNGTAMNTAINAIIPSAHPYNVTPFNYTGTETIISKPATVVDWVLVELRRPTSKLPADATAATIVGRKAGFILNNGSIVNPDGVTPISFNISKQDSAYIVVRHRNHLSVMSKIQPSTTDGTYANDFTAINNVYSKPGAASAPLTLLSGAGGKYGLWAGDANKNGAINATDVSTVKIAVANALTGYQLSDVNLSNSINATDVSLVKLSVAASATSSASRGTSDPYVNTNNSNETSSNVPD